MRSFEAIKNFVETGTTSKTRSIISDSIADLDNTAIAQLPSVPRLSRQVRRRRQQVLNTPEIPHSRTGFEIPEELRKLASGEMFLLQDSGINDSDRMLIFSTECGIEHLRKYKNWAVDGTFPSAPGMFYQVFTIHIIIGYSLFILFIVFHEYLHCCLIKLKKRIIDFIL